MHSESFLHWVVGLCKAFKTLPDNSFDGVLCCHVLEHLENPAHFLRQFLRVLKKGGRLVLVLPNNGKNTVREPDFRAGHLYGWIIPSIWNLLHVVGFKVRLARFNYASGFSRFYKLPLQLSLFALKLTGYLRRQKEMLLIAEK